jgi:mannose-6-phosphate isomerase-like protein (cupin superfamily)
LQDLVKNISDLDWIDANHVGVQKKVCFAGEVFTSKITQVAYSELKGGIEVTTHIHESMEEVFFLIDGVCEFNIQGEVILAEKQSIIRIPVNKEHSLRAITSCKFFYFGVSF